VRFSSCRTKLYCMSMSVRHQLHLHGAGISSPEQIITPLTSLPLAFDLSLGLLSLGEQNGKLNGR